MCCQLRMGVQKGKATKARADLVANLEPLTHLGPPLLAKCYMQCARRESNPGHKHGRLVRCRYTTCAHRKLCRVVIAAYDENCCLQDATYFVDGVRGTAEVKIADSPRADCGTCVLNASAACDSEWASICPMWRRREPMSVGYLNRLAARVCLRRGFVAAPMWEFERRQR